MAKYMKEGNVFASRLSLTPDLGKMADLRNALTAVTEHRQTTGARTTLTEAIWAESGSKFHVSTLFETLADAGESRERGPDAKTLELIQEVTKHTAGLGESSMWETKLGSVPPGSNRAKFILRAILQPAHGKIAQARTLLTEWGNSRLEAGIRTGLVERVWGGGGVVFAVRLPYDSIAEAETSRNETLADPDYLKFVGELSPLLGRLAQWQLDAVVVPMN